MKIIIIVLMFIFGMTICSAQTKQSLSVPETVDSAKAKDIVKLLRLENMHDWAKEIVDQVFGNYMSNFKMVQQGYWDSLRAEYHEDDFLDSLIVIYDRQFSTPEIKELIKFFSSPAGMKYIYAMQEISTETAKKANSWGTYVSRSINDRLAKDGFINRINTDNQKEKK